MTACCLKVVFFLGVCDQLHVSDKKRRQSRRKNKPSCCFNVCRLRTKAAAATTRTNREIFPLYFCDSCIFFPVSPSACLCPTVRSVHLSIAPLSAAKLTSSFLFQADGARPLLLNDSLCVAYCLTAGLSFLPSSRTRCCVSERKPVQDCLLRGGTERENTKRGELKRVPVRGRGRGLGGN